ncbi:MAG: beta-lactamase family protein, partial [Myxococcales bacterium]|nr:beta-lactamase family protein [Myxococcales bacterium]
TKPITSVAALQLLEEGRFALDEPITRWAPDLADPRVLRDPDGPLEDTVPAARPITFLDLLTHRAGFTYGPFSRGPLAAAHEQLLGPDIDNAHDPDAWIAALAQLPLVDQPGATLHYGHSTDLLGLLLARMEDRPLGEVLARRVFEPLGMVDTGFDVPADRRHRCALLHGWDDDGNRVLRTTGPGGSTLPERPASYTFESGGQGLWSTADDYLRFARIFLGGGSVDGVRVLAPETLERMTRNVLTDAQRGSAEVGRMPLFAFGHGFGLGVAVVVEPDHAFPTICAGGAGTVGWPGGFGGWWQADPTTDTAMVFLSHNLVEPVQAECGIGLGVHEAIAAFHAAAQST